MDIDLQKAVLAVDGGGTRCRFALEAEGMRHVAVLGSANVSTDLAGAAATIRDGLSQLAADLSVAPESLCVVPAYLGLAGVLDDEIAAALRRELPLKHARIEDDRRSAVRGALGDADGAVAGLGTGSFLALQRARGIRLAGGWGSRLGDEASGFWLGREALSATLKAEDGLIEKTGLTAAILARFGGRPRGIVAFALSAPPREIAALAPMVAEAAHAGDTVGRAILQRGADYVLDGLAAIGWHPGERICLIGGVSDAYRAFLPPEAAEGIVTPQGTALDGALCLARQWRGAMA